MTITYREVSSVNKPTSHGPDFPVPPSPIQMISLENVGIEDVKFDDFLLDEPSRSDNDPIIASEVQNDEFFRMDGVKQQPLSQCA